MGAAGFGRPSWPATGEQHRHAIDLRHGQALGAVEHQFPPQPQRPALAGGTHRLIGNLLELGDMGEADQVTGSSRYHVLFAMAFCLLVFSFACNLVSERIIRRTRLKAGG